MFSSIYLISQFVLSNEKQREAPTPIVSQLHKLIFTKSKKIKPQK